MKFTRLKDKHVTRVFISYRELLVLAIALATLVVLALNIYKNFKLDQKKSVAPTTEILTHNINS